MNKTWKTILQIVSYVIAAILGGAGTAAMLQAMKPEKSVQYACAVVLILTSIAMAGYQVFTLDDVANGTLMYIAQAFLLAGSIFGLNYYVNKFSEFSAKEKSK